MSHPLQAHWDRQIANWLLLCALVIFGMIVLGGVTRLTNSGLSMVEWRPLVGIIPPVTETQWLEVFDKYKQFPEYQKVNLGMSLDEFKFIFYFEYAHRVLGRLIGVLYLLPFLYFWYRGRVRSGLMPSLVVLFAMGGLQGLLGWFMVKSGLVDDPKVSQYRLTAHLGLAVAIYGAILWVALGLLFGAGTRPDQARLSRWGLWLCGLIFLMILSGGLVAGTRAGYAFNTWPLMGTSFFPPGLYGMEPAWLSAFEDLGTVQFNHRMFAYLLIVLVAGFALVALRSGIRPAARTGVFLLLGALLLQVLLGISTLLLKVPVSLGAAHQGGAVLLLSAALYTTHRLSRG